MSDSPLLEDLRRLSTSALGLESEEYLRLRTFLSHFEEKDIEGIIYSGNIEKTFICCPKCRDIIALYKEENVHGPSMGLSSDG